LGQFQIATNDDIDIWMVIIGIGMELQKLGFNVNIVLDRDTGGGVVEGLHMGKIGIQKGVNVGFPVSGGVRRHGEACEC
jgi:hypothetical protein